MSITTAAIRTLQRRSEEVGLGVGMERSFEVDKRT
jgi:hypothetical protein